MSSSGRRSAYILMDLSPPRSLRAVVASVTTLNGMSVYSDETELYAFALPATRPDTLANDAPLSITAKNAKSFFLKPNTGRWMSSDESN